MKTRKLTKRKIRNFPNVKYIAGHPTLSEVTSRSLIHNLVPLGHFSSVFLQIGMLVKSSDPTFDLLTNLIVLFTTIRDGNMAREAALLAYELERGRDGAD